MMNASWRAWALTIAALSLTTGACGEDGTNPASDAAADVGDAGDRGDGGEDDISGDASGDGGADASPDAQGDTVGDLGEDAAGGIFSTEDEDWKDCFTGCSNTAEALRVDLRTFPADGLRGTIDDEEHRYTVNGVPLTLGDIDIIGVQAAERTMVEVTVEAIGRNNPMDPIVRTFDGFVEMTYNSDAGPGTTTARTVVATGQLNGELPFYVIIEDAVNYELWNGGGGSIRGGDEYRYEVRFATSEFAPVELGTLGDSEPLEATDQVVEAPGDIHYYRFEAPATASFTVAITRTGEEPFQLYAAGMRTIEGQLIFVPPTISEESDAGEIFLDEGDFRVCDEGCGEATGEFIFAVSDLNGDGGSGFTYDLAVTRD